MKSECYNWKIYIKKPIHKGSISTTLANIWSDLKAWKISELEPILFCISMDNLIDVKIILKGNP